MPRNQRPWREKLKFNQIMNRNAHLHQDLSQDAKVPEELRKLLADELERSDIFKASEFPAKLRQPLTLRRMNLLLSDIYDFADDKRIWMYDQDVPKDRRITTPN